MLLWAGLLSGTLTPPHVIRVADYGAKPDAESDAAPAIRAALAAAKRLNGAPAVIQFAPGRYRCFGGEAPHEGQPFAPSVSVEAFENLAIDGQGATLVGRDLARLFAFKNSRHIAVRNLTVDWDPLPHTSGRVIRLLQAEHAFDLAPRIPAAPPAGRIVQGILAYDPDQHRLADNGWEVYQTQGERDADMTQRTPEGFLRIFERRNTPLPQVGWDVVVRHQVYGYDAFTFAQCGDVTMEDVTVTAVPGMAVLGWDCRDFTIRRMRVAPAKGGRMSATADAMHFSGCRGQITVDDSEFAGMGDDAINIHAMYGLVTARIDDHTLTVVRARLHPYYDKARAIWSAPANGDILEYGNGDEPLIAQGQLRVAGARQDTERQCTVIRFEEALPAGVGENTLLANVSTSPSVRVRHCSVHGNRARGLLLQTRDVLVEDCIFENISGAGVQICADAADWCESLGARDVTIQRCVFRRCNFGVARREAALDIFADLANHRQSAAGVHQRLHLLDNVFEGNTGAAIHVGSADGVDIRRNRFARNTGALVAVLNSRNVVVSGNTATNGNAGVVIQGSSDRTTIKTGGNSGF